MYVVKHLLPTWLSSLNFLDLVWFQVLRTEFLQHGRKQPRLSRTVGLEVKDVHRLNLPEEKNTWFIEAITHIEMNCQNLCFLCIAVKCRDHTTTT